MFPVIYEFVLSPDAATLLLFVAAFVVPALFAWRAYQDGKQGLVSPTQWRKTLAGGIVAALAMVIGVIRPWAFTENVELPLHTYGLMMALAFISAITVAVREARRSGLDGERVMDLSFWVLLSGLAGARILFILVNLDDYFGDNFFANDVRIFGLRIPTILVVWRGGLVFYGGLIGAFLATTGYLMKHRLPYFKYVDALAPSVPLGHFFGRMGCFAAGCCWGKECSPDSPFATYFPQGSLAFSQTPSDTHVQHLGAWTTSPVYPTQLFESLGTLLIFGLLLVIRKHKRFDGMVIISYFILYPLFRTINETFRGDWERGLLFRYPAEDPVMLSTSQVISFLVAAIGIGFIAYRMRRMKSAGSGAGEAAA